MKEKVILAYSGGLDTSVILKWLIDKGYDVICYVADVGQEEDFGAVEKKALSVGASKVYVDDLKKEFVEDYIFQSIKANAIYEGRYLLGTALARPLIAKGQIEVAKRENAHYLSHGATGKGNDQVRFELAAMRLMPSVKIIAPWRESEFIGQFKGRTDLINYASENGIPVTSTAEKPYSMDANIMHISYEAGKLEDPAFEVDSSMFLRTKSPQEAPDKTTFVEIEFKEGVPVAIDHEGKKIIGSLPIFEYLNELGCENGIGRIDIVENRFVGMKSRGAYETPGGTILYKAHLDLELLTIDREVFRLKESLVPKIAELIYNGFWFHPEMEFLMNAINFTQKSVHGTVKMALYKGNASAVSRHSEHSLYDESIASMDELGGYNQADAEGFIKILAIR